MLDSLNDQPIGSYRLRVEYLGQTRFFDQRDFALYLIDTHSNKSDSPVFRGRYNAGRPSIYVPVWIDGEFVEGETDNGRPTTEGESSVRRLPSSVESKTDEQSSVHRLPSPVAETIAQKLGALIPPGGRLWLAYEAFESEGEMMRETRAGLLANVPLVTTPIGFLLYRADCWVGLRDWHFPEGGREGPRKLQGNKAVNIDHAKQRARESVSELEDFLNQSAGNEMLKHAQARAKIVLPPLKAIERGDS